MCYHHAPLLGQEEDPRDILCQMSSDFYRIYNVHLKKVWTTNVIKIYNINIYSNNILYMIKYTLSLYIDSIWNKM